MTSLSLSLQERKVVPLAPPEPSRRGWVGPCALAAVLLAATVLRAHDLGVECFDEDELLAVRIQGVSLHALGAVMGRDAFHTDHPPLMSVPYLFWTALFGTSEASVRVLPLLFGLAAVLLTYCLTLRLGGTAAAVLASLLLAINPLHIAYSREARQYTILVALTLAAHLFFLRCLEKGGRGNRLAYGILAMLDLFTHYFAVPALAAHGIAALWLTFRGAPPIRRNALAALLTLSLAIVPFIAWLPILRFQTIHKPYHLRAGTTTDILQCLQEIGGLGRGLTIAAIAVGGLAVLLVGIGLWGRRRDDVPCSSTDVLPPLPRWGAMVLVVGGLAAAPVLYLTSPRFVLPSAEATLQGYGYEAELIATELALVRLELAAFALAAAACGGLLLAWFRILGLLERLPYLGRPSEHPLSVAGFVAALLLVPLAMVRAIALLGVPFLTSRNLLVLVPIGGIAIALGLEMLLRRKTGRLLAVLSLLCLAATVCQYEPFAELWGGQGFPQETHTVSWRGLAVRLSELPDDVPLLTHKNPATDPALYYLANYHPRRVEATSELPRRFRFIHLERNYYCKTFLNELKAQGAALKLLSQDGNAVLYDVCLEGAGNQS